MNSTEMTLAPDKTISKRRKACSHVPGLLTIYTWAGDKDKINRHLPIWKRSGLEIQFCSPSEAPCHLGGMTYGRSESYGPDHLKLVWDGLRLAYARNFPYYVFNEADSLVLRPSLPPPGPGLFCFVFGDSGTEFKGSQFFHYAWWMDRETLGRIIEAVNKYPLDIEKGFQDRALGFIAGIEGIEVHHAEDFIYSRNTIEKEEDFAAIRAKASTIRYIHGIKTEEQLSRVRQCLSDQPDTIL